jgi:hypothetical protein
MKYHIVVANPMEYGFSTDNVKMCQENTIPIFVDEMAKKYPNEPIIVMKPTALYKSKVSVETIKFNINDKMEILPA